MSFVFLACSANQDMEAKLVGTWKNKSIQVKMNSFENTDSVHWLIVEDNNWESVLNIKPIETTYFEDGRFESVYTDLNDVVLGVESGHWLLVNDSLILKSKHYNNSYSMKWHEDELQFTAWLDWDNDGKKDDLYNGRQVKIEP